MTERAETVSVTLRVDEQSYVSAVLSTAACEMCAESIDVRSTCVLSSTSLDTRALPVPLRARGWASQVGLAYTGYRESPAYCMRMRFSHHASAGLRVGIQTMHAGRQQGAPRVNAVPSAP